MVRSPNTIALELRRNRVRGTYDPRKANHKAYVRRRNAKYQAKKIVEHDGLRREVHTRIMDDQSPVAVALRISRREKQLPPISKNAVYRYIASPYGRRLDTHRILKKRRRRKRRGNNKKLTGRTMIDKRPTHINTRKRVGDVEADFIVSGKSGRGILLVVVDRRSRATFIERILPVRVRNMERAFVRIAARYPELRTVTTDNDILFAQHERLAQLLGVRIYFCHAYHSWEKGTVENTNKVIRRDIPKGADLSRHTKHYIQRLEAKLNRRPMGVLQYRTPAEMLERYRSRVATNKKRANAREKRVS